MAASLQISSDACAYAAAHHPVVNLNDVTGKFNRNRNIEAAILIGNTSYIKSS